MSLTVALTADELRQVAHKALGYKEIPVSPRTDSMEVLWRSFGPGAPHSPLALKRCATEGPPITVLDSPSPRSPRSSDRSHASPTALRKARTMEDLGDSEQLKSEIGTPKVRRLLQFGSPEAPIGESEYEQMAWPLSPSPQRRQMPLISPHLPIPPSPQRPWQALSPRTPRRATGRLLFSPTPARVLTYGTRREKVPDAESLPTPPPTSPAGPAKRRRLLTDLPVPSLTSPKPPTEHPAPSAVEAAEPSESVLAPHPSRPGLSEPPPPKAPRTSQDDIHTPGVVTSPAPTSPVRHSLVSPVRPDPDAGLPDLFALVPQSYAMSSPLADRVRATKPSAALASVPRPLSLRSRLRRARLSVR